MSIERIHIPQGSQFTTNRLVVGSTENQQNVYSAIQDTEMSMKGLQEAIIALSVRLEPVLIAEQPEQKNGTYPQIRTERSPLYSRLRGMRDDIDNLVVTITNLGNRLDI